MAEGLAPIQNWVKALIDRVLAEDFAAPDLEFCWNEDRTQAADFITLEKSQETASLSKARSGWKNLICDFALITKVL